MAGLFDDLVPNQAPVTGAPAAAATPVTGLFDDLVPAQGGSPAGPVMVDDFGRATTLPAPAAPAAPAQASGQWWNDAPPVTFAPPAVTPAQPAATDKGMVGAAAMGALNGVWGVGPALRDAGLYGAALVSKIRHPSESFDDSLAQVKRDAVATDAAHPYASTAGNIAGGVIGMAPAIAAAPAAFGLGDGPLFARAMVGMGSGATVGGVDAGVRSDGQSAGQVARDVAVGAGVGGGLGGVAPVAGSALGGLYARLAGTTVPEAADVPAAARQYLVKQILADNPDAVMANMRQLGDQGMMLDYGPALRGIGQGLATKPGPAQQSVISALTDRNLGVNARIGSVVDGALGPAQSPLVYQQGLDAQIQPLAKAQQAALAAAGPVDVSDAYAKAVAALPNTAPTSPENAALAQALRMLGERPQVAGRTGTYEPLPDDAVNVKTGGSEPQMYGPSETDAPPSDPIAAVAIDPTLVPTTNAQRIYSARQALDDVINYGGNGLSAPSSAIRSQQGAYSTMRRALSDALKDQVPGYGDATDKIAALAKQRGALEDGTAALGGGKTSIRPDDFAASYSNLSPDEQAAYRVGMRSTIDQALGTKENDLQALRLATQGDNGWNAQKLGTAFGQDNADALNHAVANELKMRESYGKVAQNSETARNTAAAKGLEDAEYDPFQIGHVHNLTWEGLAATGIKQPINAILRMVQPQADNTARDLALARITTAQGANRNQILANVLRAQNAADANAALAAPVDRAFSGGVAVAPAVLAAALRGRRQGMQP